MIRRRKAVKDDRYILRLIYKELYPQTRKSLPDAAFDKQSLKQRLRKGVTFVAVPSGGRTIGFINTLIKDDVLVIDMLAVRRELHRKGWGSRLLERAEEYGKHKGCGLTSLFVDINNEGGQRFYARHGYGRGGYIPTIKCFQMYKDLK